MERTSIFHLFWEIFAALIIAIYRTFLPLPPKPIDNDTVLITGAGQGIGRQLALQLVADHGVKRIVCWDINQKSCDDTASEVRALMRAKHGCASCWSLQCDVSDREQVRKAAEITRSQCGRVTMLINNAGILPARPFLEFSSGETIRKIFEVNTYSQFWTIFEFLPDMLVNGGHIVSMCSIAGVASATYMVPYSASKHAIRGLMKGLDLELRETRGASHPVKLTTVYPFTVNTGLAHNPTTRFPSIYPIIQPEYCARAVIDAVRRDQEEVYVPRIVGITFKLLDFFPKRAQNAMIDFSECRVGISPDAASKKSS